MQHLPEVTQLISLAQHEATAFPATCPCCGSERTEHNAGTEVMECLRTAGYACGARYTSKPQNQTHTEKWWGKCPGPPAPRVHPTTEYDPRGGSEFDPRTGRTVALAPNDPRLRYPTCGNADCPLTSNRIDPASPPCSYCRQEARR